MLRCTLSWCRISCPGTLVRTLRRCRRGSAGPLGRAFLRRRSLAGSASVFPGKIASFGRRSGGPARRCSPLGRGWSATLGGRLASPFRSRRGLMCATAFTRLRAASTSTLAALGVAAGSPLRTLGTRRRMLGTSCGTGTGAAFGAPTSAGAAHSPAGTSVAAVGTAFAAARTRAALTTTCTPVLGAARRLRPTRRSRRKHQGRNKRPSKEDVLQSGHGLAR